MSASVTVSIVTPVYNEADILDDFYRQLTDALKKCAVSYEIIFIDDGSGDTSWNHIGRFHKNDPAVHAIRFTRNFGQQVALSAGLDVARGAAVICMNSDLQHPPTLISTMLGKWRKGALVVNTEQKNDRMPFVNNFGTALFYRLINSFSKVKIPSSNPDFRLLDRSVVNTFRSIHERDRFVSGLVQWLGFPTVTLPFAVPETVEKKRDYTFRKVVHLALDAMTSFTAIPLRLALYCGVIISFFSALYGLYALSMKYIYGTAVQGWTSLIIISLFIGGCQMIFLGIVGEYLFRIFNEMKKRPLYVKMEELN